MKHPIQSLANLQAEIDKVYLIKDPYITKAMVAFAIAHFLSSDPCWPVIVAPSGGCKSEMINLLSLIKWTPPPTEAVPDPREEQVHALDALTSKTFISGAKSIGRDTSLLLQIKNGIITFPDLTLLMSENKDERAIIMGQLRKIYDGKYTKSFGTGESIPWEGKITIIAGSTYSIHNMKQAYTSMGERFIFYNLEQPDGFAAGWRTMENQEEGKMAEHRARLAGLFRDYVLHILNNMPMLLSKITDEQRRDALNLAELATRARSAVQRNWASREQEIISVDPPEMPTRFAGQLQTVMRALQVINDHDFDDTKLLAEDEKILSKLALDSVDRQRRTAMIELSRYDVLETAAIATRIGMPTNSVRKPLEDLTALEMADRVKGSGGSKGDKWSIKPKYRELIMRYEGVKREGEELTEYGAELEASKLDPVSEQGQEEDPTLSLPDSSKIVWN